MSEPKPVTCETESEAEKVESKTASKRSSKTREKSRSVGSASTTRQGKSRETTEARSPSEKFPGQASSSRPPMEQRASASRSEGTHQELQSSRLPSRAPSMRSGSSRSDRRQQPCPEGCEHCRMDTRGFRESDTLRPHTDVQSVRVSPTSSRASRAPSRGSNEMPPPPVPRTRSASATRARPSSFHSGMGNPYFPANTHSNERGMGPPPARSAYAGGSSSHHPIRPPLSVVPNAPSAYSDPLAMQHPAYGQMRSGIPHRAHTDFSTASSAPSQYSARRPVSYYPEQPSPHEVSTAGYYQPPSPTSLRDGRKYVSARQPAHVDHYGQGLYDRDNLSATDRAWEDDYHGYETRGMYIQAHQPHQRSFPSHLSARGSTSHSSHDTSPQYDHRDKWLDDGFASASDYKSSVRSKDTDRSGSSQSRRPSLASSGIGTKGTSYSASSGSGGYPSQRRVSGYEQFQTTSQDRVTEAELYMRSKDQQAQYVRHQQPQLTQESLRLQQERAIEARRPSQPSTSSSTRVGGSHRSRTITADEEEALRVLIDTTAGMNLQLEGDTKGRPIQLVQKPGETQAELIIGQRSRADTVLNTRGSPSRRDGTASRVTAQTGASGATVSGRK